LASVLKNPPDEDGRKLRPAVCEIVVIFLLRPIVRAAKQVPLARTL
jgi:hypothetical protein